MSSKNNEDSDIDIVKFESVTPANTRLNLLQTLANTIQKLDYKYQNGRIQDIKKEKTKTDQARAIIYGINVANNVLKDFELSEVLFTLNEIKDTINNPAIADVPEVTSDKLDMIERTLKIMED